MKEIPQPTNTVSDDELTEACAKEIAEVLRKYNCKHILRFTHKDNENALGWELFIEKMKE
jgi:hypothetical protein